MSTTFIRYKSGYKYQLVEEYRTSVIVSPARNIASEYIELNTSGTLTIMNGYAWDGPSGWTIDSNNFMRGSLVHDALYQLMRQGRLDPEEDRKTADQELRRICREDGMSAIRAWWVYQGVRIGGARSAQQESAKEVEIAPPQED